MGLKVMLELVIGRDYDVSHFSLAFAPPQSVRVFSKIFTLFIKWKSSLKRKFVQRGIRPKFRDPKYPRCEDYWDEDASYKILEKAR